VVLVVPLAAADTREEVASEAASLAVRALPHATSAVDPTTSPAIARLRP
jgi:hypothetical protein